MKRIWISDWIDNDYCETGRQSKINLLLNAKYFDKCGESVLRKRLTEKGLIYLDGFEIVLRYSYDDKNDTMTSLSLGYSCGVDNDIMRETFESYFKNELGYESLNAQGYDEIKEMVNRISQDVPYIKACIRFDE